MKHIENFHTSYKILWEYRLKNIKMLTRDVHQIIITLSLCDYYIKYHNRINIHDYEFIMERFIRSRDYIDNNSLIRENLSICLEIIESFVLMEEMHELGN